MNHDPLALSLLDFLAHQVGSTYLSDLPRMSGARLVRELEQIPAEAASLRDWNDALDYLTGAPPEDTAQAAKERLVHLLSQPCSAGIDKAT